MLLAVLVFIFVSCLAAGVAAASAHTEMQRDKEEQLLFAGMQIRAAILSYYGSIPPGGVRTLPPDLEALLNDNRFATPRHHLRRLYSDPMTGNAQWTLVLAGGSLVGVHSRSALRPLRIHDFPLGCEGCTGAARYEEWKFVIRP